MACLQHELIHGALRIIQDTDELVFWRDRELVRLDSNLHRQFAVPLHLQLSRDAPLCSFVLSKHRVAVLGMAAQKASDGLLLFTSLEPSSATELQTQIVTLVAPAAALCTNTEQSVLVCAHTDGRVSFVQYPAAGADTRTIVLPDFQSDDRLMAVHRADPFHIAVSHSGVLWSVDCSTASAHRMLRLDEPVVATCVPPRLNEHASCPASCLATVSRSGVRLIRIENERVVASSMLKLPASWDAQAGVCRQILGVIVSTPAGRTVCLCALCPDGSCAVWSAATGQLVSHFDLPCGPIVRLLGKHRLSIMGQHGCVHRFPTS